jgi:hypothetical protein
MNTVPETKCQALFTPGEMLKLQRQIINLYSETLAISAIAYPPNK